MFTLHTLTKKIIGTAALTCSFLGAAIAGPIVDEVPDGLNLIDVNQDIVYFTESYVNGIGRYTVTNNVKNSTLVGFGVTNIDTTAAIESDNNPGSYYDFGGGLNDNNSWYYNAYTIDATNWDAQSLGWGAGDQTAEQLFGDIDSFFEGAENTLNWYAANDGAIESGVTWDGFVFLGNIPASSLYAIVESEDFGGTYISGPIAPLNEAVAEVDEPAMFALVSLLLIAAGYRRKI